MTPTNISRRYSIDNSGEKSFPVPKLTMSWLCKLYRITYKIQ